jgi:endonuclease/exonuclease/phosphatase family metal-dependent hydrolase
LQNFIDILAVEKFIVMILTKQILSGILFFLFIPVLMAQKSDQPTIRVLTFNILHGATVNNDFDLDKIASVIKEADPDLVALQEVDFKTTRANKYDLVTELGWRTKMTSLFGKAMDFDGGGYGEGILTKMPIISSRNVPLPYSEGNESRAALEVMVELDSGDTICFIGTHLEHKKNDPDRMCQARRINEIFLLNTYPTILAGDLNDTPKSAPIQVLNKFWTDASGKDATFPSNEPQRKIDYIMYLPSNKWEVLETKVICDEVASDHCAVLSVLRLNE